VQPRTKRQKEVLEFVTRFMDRNGHKPSYQQIARHLGVRSRAGVQRHIAALESQGLISRRRENGAFGIEFPQDKIVTEKVCDIELIEVSEADGGYVESGRKMLTVPRCLIGNLAPAEVFAYRTPDDSMIDRHICEGDIVFLERRSYARRGEPVSAKAGERLILGLYYNHGLETEVRPANDQYEPQIFASDEIRIEGVIRGVFRPFPTFE
jgi:repressor LexA